MYISHIVTFYFQIKHITVVSDIHIVSVHLRS